MSSVTGFYKTKCPHCGEEFDAECWAIARGDQDPEIKEFILTGEFDMLRCPKCETFFRHEEPFLYYDEDKEFMAIVMPEEYADDKASWLKKIKSQYDPLREALDFTKNISSEAYYFFGMDNLREILKTDQDRDEETEVISFMAEEEGFELRRIKPGTVREKDIPAVLPLPKGESSRESAIRAASTLYGKNEALGRLKKLIELLKSENGTEINILK